MNTVLKALICALLVSLSGAAANAGQLLSESFETDGEGKAVIVEENLDECVLCELCIEAAPPGQVRVTKLYSGETLSR